MSKITIEIDIEELKVVMAGILAERVIRVLPQGTKLDIAKKVKREAERIAVDKLSKELEIV